MMNARQPSPEAGHALADRCLEHLEGRSGQSCVLHDALHTLSPGIVLRAQTGELLPDADLIGLWGGQHRIVQDIERDIRQFFHAIESTLASWRFLCA